MPTSRTRSKPRTQRSNTRRIGDKENLLILKEEAVLEHEQRDDLSIKLIILLMLVDSLLKDVLYVTNKDVSQQTIQRKKERDRTTSLSKDYPLYSTLKKHAKHS